MGSLAPTRADLLPPRKRLKDSYSPETSMEEDIEIDTTETEDGRELDIIDGDDVKDHIEVDPRDDREEFEASDGDTVVLGIDLRSVPMVDKDIIEPVGGDSSSSLAWRRVSPRFLDHHSYSSSSSSDSLPVHSSGLDASVRLILDVRLKLYHLDWVTLRPSRKKCRSLTNSVPSCAQVMGSLAPTPSAIAISSDSSDESVGSLPSRVILFGDTPTVIPFISMVAPETSTIAPVILPAAPVVETTIVASPTRLCDLVPYSDLDSDPSEASDSFDGPPSQDPYVTTVAH
nr:hypothetical protein [Tanacetum cinerariifolium]